MTSTQLVRTVDGDIASASLGRTDAHEHVFLSSPALAGEDFQDFTKAAQELVLVKESGIDTVVDLTTIGLGRRPAELAEVSRRSGLNIIAATGFHRDAHYGPSHWIQSAARATLLDALISDVQKGIEASDWTTTSRNYTSARAGIIKAGASYQKISASERLRLDICAEAALITGVPLAVHTEVGTAGHEILDAVERAGLSADRVLLAHLDRNPDADVHEELIQRGASLVYDTIGRIKYRPESTILDLCEEMVDRGHADHLMLGTDVGRRSTLLSYGGGPGMDVLGRTFIPRLHKRIGIEATDVLLVSAPARFFVLQGDPQ